MTEEKETQKIFALKTESQVRDPKSTQGIFDLPCGYLTSELELLTEVKVREIDGNTEDMLGARNIPGGKKLTQLIANCLERIGPISEKDAMLEIARKLTIGDRVFLTLAIRRVTLGEEFPFEEKCPGCDKKSLYVEDLYVLKIKKMPEPKKRVYELTLPSGKQARFHVMIGKDEELLTQIGSTDQVSAAIAVRLDLLDGAPISLEAVKALTMRDRNALRDKFEEVEGGVDTTIHLTCPNCGENFDTELNVGQTGFFFPSRVRKNSKSNIFGASNGGG